MWTFVSLLLCFFIGIAMGSAGISLIDWQCHAIVLSIAAIRIIDQLNA